MSAEQTRPSLAHGIDIIRKRWPEVVSGSTEMPIFICAAGWRSGSTFLQRLITPSCFLWGEPYGQSWMIDALSDPLRRFSRNWPEPHFFYRGQHADTLSGTFIANLYPSPKDLMEAHHAFFDRLFIQPVRKNGYVRWGLKEVRLSADHACYLKWLFPLAKFLFLYRNPYDCYRSYAARRNSGWKWFNRFPDQPLNVQNFGRHWRTLVTSFLEGHSQVDGLLVQYEDMAKGDFGPIEEYLGLKLSADAAEVNPSDGGPPPVESIPETELIELKREVGELAEKMGYSAPQSSQTEISASESSAVPPRSQCVVLVPTALYIDPACEQGLQELERRGYTVRRRYGASAIDQVRSQMAANVLADGFEETFWIDSDVAFNPDDIDRLREHNLPIVCGIYPKKGRRELAVHVLPGTSKLTFGKKGGLQEIRYAAGGFLLVRRQVYLDIQEQLNIPLCNEHFGQATIPFFQPYILEESGKKWYLAEDYAFCERARLCGYKIMADTTIRLEHIGSYRYSWEDAGGSINRFSTFNFILNRPVKERGVN